MLTALTTPSTMKTQKRVIDLIESALAPRFAGQDSKLSGNSLNRDGKIGKKTNHATARQCMGCMHELLNVTPLLLLISFICLCTPENVNILRNLVHVSD